MARAAVDVSTWFAQENIDLEDGLSLQCTVFAKDHRRGFIKK